jgi:hypothetical protein
VREVEEDLEEEEHEHEHEEALGEELAEVEDTGEDVALADVPDVADVDADAQPLEPGGPAKREPAKKAPATKKPTKKATTAKKPQKTTAKKPQKTTKKTRKKKDD